MMGTGQSLFALVSEDHGTFRLRSGANEVGRDAGAAVNLRDRSISQRHAVVEALEEWLLVRDLASKNGTFVNGAPASATKAVPGDEIRFGRLVFRLEVLDPEDAWLAVAAPASQDSSAQVSSAHSTVVTQTQESEIEVQRLRAFVEEVTNSTARGENSAVLALLCRELGSRTAVLLRQDGAKAAQVLASAGSLELDSGDLQKVIARSKTTGTGTAQARVTLEGASYLVACRTLKGSHLLLIVSGESSPHTSAGWLVSTTLAILALGLPEKQAATESIAQAARLVFPDDHARCPSRRMARLYEEIRAAAGSDLPVLIQGETGVGKESVAEILHRSSPRSRGRLQAINCAAIPTDLLEAELFGVASGAATGVVPRTGKLEAANGGTVLLDEVGEMKVDLQAKLLRVLEQGVVEPVGGSARALDIRVVASTNRDLRDDISTGRFRADLFYRLSAFVLEVPALHDRTSDIGTLVEHFFASASKESKKVVLGITYAALKELTERDWPGNVRELRHAVFRAVYATPAGEVIDSRRIRQIESVGTRANALDSRPDAPIMSLEELELQAIRAALRQTEGNQAAAAKALGISRGALRRRIEKHGLGKNR